MNLDLPQRLQALFSAETRLHALQGDGPLANLMVEAWSMKEALNQPWQLHISVLCTSVHQDTNAMLGQRITLLTRLADGSQAERSGIVTTAGNEESDGGLARYRLTVQPWWAAIANSRRSQCWQERNVVEIVDAVFSAYPWAAWEWGPCVAAHLAQSPCGEGGLRSTCAQYRETDLAFITRLLAEEGLNYRHEQDPSAPLGHKLVIFADSTRAQSCPEDHCSASILGGPGIRFHRVGVQEENDTIQAFGGERQYASAEVASLSWDYKAKASAAAVLPTAAAFAGPNAPRLQAYDYAGAYAYQGSTGANRAAELLMQSIEARHKRWLGRSTVRSFTAGTQFTLTQSTLDLLAALDGKHAGNNQFLLTSVIHAGINNLPKDASAQIARSLNKAGADLLAPWVPAELRQQAAESGYANCFECSRTAVPWRPAMVDASGAQLGAKPTGPGHLSATVVGPDAQTTTSGAEEIHTDALGRIRIQFDFQKAGWQGAATSQTSTWVRVAQPMAGAGLGVQFIPRIGQEVLVQFINNDIDRPIVVGSLYNGRGEGGVPATPGGKAADADTSAFAQSSDHSPSTQGNTAGGNSPAWHGAAPGAATAGSQAQANAAALSGFKSKEFGGSGYSQLVFDDSDSQLRVQLATTQHASQLNLGHLVHQADNHRGSFRGLGFELRTDAFGAVRAGSGLLISSYGTQPSEPAGDNAAGMALAKQLQTLGETFSKAAVTHQTVALAGHIGSVKTGASGLNDHAASFKALHTSLAGMVSSGSDDEASADAARRNTSTGDDKLPHSTDPIIAIAGKAGLAQTAGQDIQLSAADNLALASGQDTHIATGGAQRIHAGQAIGVLGGAIKPGPEAAGKGLTMIAAQGDVEFQAQASSLQVAAKLKVDILSAIGSAEFAAAKKISISTAGGANITIEGGNITVQCPGTITIRASVKQFLAGQAVWYAMPQLPRYVCVECLLAGAANGAAFAKRS